MAANILIYAVIGVSFVRTIGYCVYTFKTKNVSGGVGIAILAAMSLAAAAVFTG